jgi:hypothetical protein
LWASASCGATGLVAPGLVTVVGIVTTDSSDPEDEGITQLVGHARESLACARANRPRRRAASMLRWRHVRQVRPRESSEDRHHPGELRWHVSKRNAETRGRLDRDRADRERRR